MMERSSRQRKASMKLRVFLESEDSEDDFAPQTKKSKSKGKSEGVVEKSNASVVSKSKRLSRDEKLFNRDLEKTLAKSKDTLLSSTKEDESIDTSCSGSPPSVSQPVEEPTLDDTRVGQPVEEPTLDDTDYIPGGNNHSDSDDDFEPSPPVKKSTECKKTKKVPAKKENVKVSVKSVAAIKCDKLVGSLKPTPSTVSTVKGTDLPGSRPPAEVPQAPVEPTTTPPVVRRKGVAKWVPPARIGNSASASLPKGTIPPVKSAGGGAPAIRVGLSRRAPIKPLHAQQSPLN